MLPTWAQPAWPQIIANIFQQYGILANPLDIDGATGNNFIVALENAVNDVCPLVKYKAMRNNKDKVYAKVNWCIVWIYLCPLTE